MTAQQLKVLIPAYQDFDPTEIAVPWKLLSEWGQTTPVHPDGIIKVSFTTIDGKPAQCDSLVLKGPIFGFFGASKEAKKAYEEMVKSEEFMHPLKWEDTDFGMYDGVWLGGGHAKGVREYLDSTVLQSKLARFVPMTKAGCSDPKVLAAICHGPVLLSRTMDETGKSVLAGRRTSCLPYHMERDAYNVSIFAGVIYNLKLIIIQLTRFHLGDYYSEYLKELGLSSKSHSLIGSYIATGTYPTFVQHEVEASGALEVRVGPETVIDRLLGRVNIPFTVEDGDNNYVSARWPGDTWALAKLFVARLMRTKKLSGFIDDSQ